MQRLLLALMGPSDSMARRHVGKRLLVLAAAIGVPAFAAPGDWKLDSAPDPDQNMLAATQEIMPFETPGMGFPGSAFYFLEDTPEASLALPALDPNETEQDRSLLGTRIDAGPSARAFLSAGGGIDKARALRCMTQAIYYEAASESDAGQRAVAQVVLNRVAHPTWPNSVCGVVFEGSQRSTGCQFTFTCDGSLNRQPSQSGWDRAQRVAARALAGEVYEPIGLATHYHTNWVNPYWAKTLDHIGTIGAHRFYRWRGAAGLPSAFSDLYSGRESAIARTRASTDSLVRASAPAPDAAITATVPSVAPASITAAAPAAQAPNSPYAGAGRVKDEYANAGRWKSDPARPAK